MFARITVVSLACGGACEGGEAAGFAASSMSVNSALNGSRMVLGHWAGAFLVTDLLFEGMRRCSGDFQAKLQDGGIAPLRACVVQSGRLPCRGSRHLRLVQ